MTMEFINRSVQLQRQHSIVASNQKRKKGTTCCRTTRSSNSRPVTPRRTGFDGFLTGFDANNRHICGREARQMFGFQNECLTALERLLTKSNSRCLSVSFLQLHLIISISHTHLCRESN